MIASPPRKPAVLRICLLLASIAVTACGLEAQDWVRTGTNLGVSKIRIAAADFKAGSADPQTGGLKSAFDQTLYNAVSYTHLDVYKRQLMASSMTFSGRRAIRRVNDSSRRPPGKPV